MQCWRGVLLALLLGSAAWPATAAEPDWIWLQAPSFAVVSQLDERETRRWAGEFDQFVETLHRVYAVDERKLAPLVIVLFERARGFAPYRPVTASGQAKKVDGLFGRRANWSVIGLAGSRGSEVTRRIIQHEAVHWFFSARSSRPPLWLGEGVAEVFSTFEVNGGKGRIGDAIPEHVGYLNQVGLLPLEEFFQVSQDEALHENERFYPQSWALVHFGLFGNGGAERERLAAFERLLETEPRDTAFESAFGSTYAEVDQELERYLDGGRHGVSVVDVIDRSAGFAVDVATEDQVEVALARLALVGRNDALALQHANTLVERLPDGPEGYEIIAQANFAAGDLDGARRAAARAVETGSGDAGLYLLEAQLMLDEHLRAGDSIDQALEPHRARTIADTLTRSLALQPRNPEAYELLVIALVNVPELTESDRRVLDTGQRFLPRSGLMRVALAAAANRAGDVDAALALLSDARSDTRELPRGIRVATTDLEDRWLFDDLSRELQAVSGLVDLDAFDARLAAATAMPDRSAALRKSLQDMSDWSRNLRRFLEAVAAADTGDIDGARDLLQAILEDPDADRDARANAERALRNLSN